MKARYFCESCGSEVKAGAAVCPSCGKVFTAVRCPKCGFEGGTSDFRNGCPSCGYLDVLPRPAQGSAARSARRDRGPALPAWAYRVLLIGLVVAVVILLAVLLLRV